jgi:hypothetical protein
MNPKVTDSAAAQTWARVMARLAEFSSAVLAGRDAQGYPYSVRCQPQPDHATRTLHVPELPGTLLQSGPASLLCHWHDERLWNQRSFLVRGMLMRSGAEWVFQPRQYIEGVGYGGLMGLVRFVVGARRNAASYLAKRGLPRPRIPWDEVIAAKRQAKLPQRPSQPLDSQPINPALVAAAAVGIVGVCCLLLALLLAHRGRTR